MATAIAPQEIAGPYLAEATAAQLTTVTFTAGTVAGNSIVIPGRKILLLINNSDASPGTVTITSSADPYGRTATITAFSIAAGAYVARIFEPVGWEQTLGGRDLLITPSAVTIEILAIPL